MLSSDDLARLRAVQLENMPNVALIKRPAGVADSSGGTSDALTTVASNVPCRVRSSARDLRAKAVAEQMGVTLAYTITFPIGTDVQELDKVTVTGWPALQVVAAPLESYGTARVCDCVEKK